MTTPVGLRAVLSHRAANPLIKGKTLGFLFRITLAVAIDQVGASQLRNKVNS